MELARVKRSIILLSSYQLVICCSAKANSSNWLLYQARSHFCLNLQINFLCSPPPPLLLQNSGSLNCCISRRPADRPDVTMWLYQIMSYILSPTDRNSAIITKSWDVVVNHDIADCFYHVLHAVSMPVTSLRTPHGGRKVTYVGSMLFQRRQTLDQHWTNVLLLPGSHLAGLSLA